MKGNNLENIDSTSFDNTDRRSSKKLKVQANASVEMNMSLLGLSRRCVFQGIRHYSK